MTSTHDTSKSSDDRADRWRLSVAVLLAVAIAALATVYRNELSLTHLVQYEDSLRKLHDEQPMLVFASVFGVFVAVTALSLPLSTALTVVCGWYFPFWRAVVLVSFASTAGATVAFWLSRYLLRDVVRHRFGGRLTRINQSLERDGAFYLFSLRLVPVIPFFVLNPAMGLTPIRARTFWWVSQLGILPVNLVWVAVGASAPSLRVLDEEGLSGLPTTQIAVAFTLLGLLLLAIKKWFRSIAR